MSQSPYMGIHGQQPYVQPPGQQNVSTFNQDGCYSGSADAREQRDIPMAGTMATRQPTLKGTMEYW